MHAMPGSLSRDALVDALNALLSAELAGAKVAVESLREVADGPQKTLLDQVHYGEADSCRRLRHCLKHLGAEPTREVGAFHAKAMAIKDLGERLAFVDRGQRWVIRKVGELLATPLDAPVREELEAVLRTHETNSEAAVALSP